MADKVITLLEGLPKPATLKQAAKANQRVAAYARVSTDHDDQESSLEAQTDYYKKQILEHPGWEFVRIYVDDGISGLSTNRRAGFNSMIEDALSGRIEIFLRRLIQCPVNGSVENGLKQRLSADLDVLPKAFFFYASM